jgi:hypothetical protein
MSSAPEVVTVSTICYVSKKYMACLSPIKKFKHIAYKCLYRHKSVGELKRMMHNFRYVAVHPNHEQEVRSLLQILNYSVNRYEILKNYNNNSFYDVIRVKIELVYAEMFERYPLEMHTDIENLRIRVGSKCTVWIPSMNRHCNNTLSANHAYICCKHFNREIEICDIIYQHCTLDINLTNIIVEYSMLINYNYNT